MVVLEAHVPKAFSNRFKSCAFGLIPECIVGVSSVNDFTKQYQRRVAGKIVFFQYCLEGTLFAVMPQVYAFNIEWRGAQPLSFVNDFVGRDKEKFGMLVHEILDEPWTSHPIYFHFFSSNPFHNRSVRQVSECLACWRAANSEEFLRISAVTSGKLDLRLNR